MEEDSRSTTRIGSSYHSRRNSSGRSPGDPQRKRSSSRSERILHDDDEDDRKPPAVARKTPPLPGSSTNYFSSNGTILLPQKSSSPKPAFPKAIPCDAPSYDASLKGGSIHRTSHTAKTVTSTTRRSRSNRRLEDDEASIHAHPSAPPVRNISGSSHFGGRLTPADELQKSFTSIDSSPTTASSIQNSEAQISISGTRQQHDQHLPTIPDSTNSPSISSTQLDQLQQQQPPEPYLQISVSGLQQKQQNQKPNQGQQRQKDDHLHVVGSYDESESMADSSTMSDVSSKVDMSTACSAELLVRKIYAATNGGGGKGRNTNSDSNRISNYSKEALGRKNLYPKFDAEGNAIYQDSVAEGAGGGRGAADAVARTRSSSSTSTCSVGKGVLLSDEATSLVLEDKMRAQDERDRAQKQRMMMSSGPYLGQPHKSELHNSNTNGATSGGGMSSNLSLISETDHSRTDSWTTVPNPPSLAQRQHYIQPGAFRMTSDGFVEQPNADGDTPTVTPMSSIVREQAPLAPPAIAGTTTTTRRAHRGGYMVEASLVADRLNIRDDESIDDVRCSAGDDQEEPSSSTRFPSPPDVARYTTSLGELTAATATSVASPIVEAHRVDENHAIRMFFRNRKVQFGLSLLAALFILLVVGTVAGVTGFGRADLKNDAAPAPVGPVPTSSPTSPPTMENDLDLKYFVNNILPSYTKASMARDDSAQSKALFWLQYNNTNLASYSIQRRLQRFALATLYFATRGNTRWVNTAGWLSDDHECMWFQKTFGTSANVTTTKQTTKPGVCNDKDEYIELSLGRNGLRGTLPDELGLLTALTQLTMPENIITGSLPSTLGKLTMLERLRLWDNYLSGSVPEELSTLTNLEILDLEFNFLAQVLPRELGRLTNLRKVLIDRNLLVGNLFTEIGKLTQLEQFHAYVNSFTGSIPTEIGNLSNLKDAQFNLNYFSGAIPSEIGMMESLVHLNLYNNSLVGTLPTEIGNCQQLTYLDVFGNQLSGSIPSTFGNLINADRLYFEQNNLEGSLPTELGRGMKYITTFWISENSITGTLPSELGHWKKLESFNVSYNEFSGTLPTEVGYFTNLQEMSLKSNNFFGTLPSELGLLTMLTKLELEHNNFTGIVPQEICDLINYSNYTGGMLSMANLTADCNLVRCACCTCV